MYDCGDTVYLKDGARRRAFILRLTFFYEGDKYGVLFPRLGLFGKTALIARARSPYTPREEYFPLPLGEQQELLRILQR